MITDEMVQQLADGATSFDEFARQTQGDFVALASHVASIDGLPGCMQIDDLVQEMLLAVHKNLRTHDSAKGGFASHVILRACGAARHAIKRSRNLQERDVELQSGMVQLPLQEDVRLAAERLQVLPTDDRQRAILGSLIRTGSLDVTTSELLAHPATRRMFTNPARARHSVYRTATKLAHRAQAVA